MAFTLALENKEYLQGDDFVATMSAVPGLGREEARLVDDIRWYMQTQGSVALLACLDEKIHTEEGDPRANKAYCDNDRVNKRSSKLTYKSMTAAQLRYFVKKFESIHPEITKLIFKDLKKHPMHSPVSSSVGTIAMYGSDNSSTELSNQFKAHEFQDKGDFKKVVCMADYKIPSPVSLGLRQQQFPETNDWTEKLNAVSNAVFISALPNRTYGKVMAYNPSASHGLPLNNDGGHPERAQKAVTDILKGLKDTFGDQVKLMDHLLPLLPDNDASKIAMFFKFKIEGVESITDPHGSKLGNSQISNKILYAYVERFVDDNIGGKYIQD